MAFLTATASAVASKALYILVAVLFFGVIILIHELGHFIFAKLFKVKVNEFALGMGPTILKKQGKETKYALRLFPIGGFVSMEGENEDSEDESALGKKAVWKRMIIVAAGGVFNIILGIIICAVMISQSDIVGTSKIYHFQENASSQATGLMEGDEILSINGKRVYSIDYDYGFLIQRDSDGVFDMVVRREGEKVELSGVKFATTEGEDGKNIITNDIVFIGVDPSASVVFTHCFTDAVSICRMVYLSLFDLVTGQYNLSDMSGPIGTVDIIADVAQTSAEEMDYSYLLMIMALITINIGLFNLLPIPALDGGRLFFMLIELVFRKPVPQKYERWVHAVGLVLLLAFIAVISVSDIVKLIKG